MKTTCQIVATLLKDTMTSSGIMDDYDEILDDMFAQGDAAAVKEYHESVRVSLTFINFHNDDHISLDEFDNTFNVVSADYM